MINEVKALRVNLDGLAQLTRNLKPLTYKYYQHYLNDGRELTVVHNDILDGTQEGFNSKEINKAIDSLVLAKAWLGKILGELGNQNPYKSGYKTKEDIEPTADTHQFSKEWEDTLNHIERVDFIRTEIQYLWDKVMNPDFHTVTFGDDDMGDLYWNNFYTHLAEVRFWLGFELARVREEK